MKPHLRKKFGIWSCASVEAGVLRLGYGYTPRMAYEEWQCSTA